MAKIFLSYDHRDSDRARPLALALERAGHFVWWDLHIRGGEQFSKKIDEALQTADAVVVLWSERSIESAWVRDEAAAGRESGRLIPVSLDDAKPPLGFRQYQTIDLSHWKGRGKPAQLQSLFADLDALAGSARDASDQTSQPRPVATPGRAFSWRILAPIAGLLIAIGAAVGWKQLWPSSTVPSVTIEAAGQSGGSRSLARDLFVKLGSLQASNAEAIRLLDAQSGGKPTLILEVGGDADAAEPHANLVLLDGQERSLYWSREFSAPAGKASDLRQQLGFTAARVVGCAAEGLNVKSERLNRKTLKSYLNACAAHAEITSTDSETVVPMFREVTKEAPGFEGGWTGLLLAELDVFLGSGRQRMREQIEKDVAAARTAHPDLIAIKQAEIDLLPLNAFAKRMSLADRAVELGPNNPLPYAMRAQVFQSIGRMSEAVQDARKAVQLDPLSPPFRDMYIQTLLYAGRGTAAQRELEEAERLWPGASNVAGARFRINLRYGDPNEALAAIRGGLEEAKQWVGVDSYLEARIDSSPAKVERAIQDTRLIYRRYPPAIGHVAQVYGEFDRERELLEIMLKAPAAVAIKGMEVLFRPALAEFWNDPAALLVAKRTGLLQFWHESAQWPDFCSRNDLPYDCKKEAAKLLA